MPILIGPSAAPYIAPTITLSASTNYNQNSGVVNATINTIGNRDVISVDFQLSTTSDFSSGNTDWFAASTNTTIAQGSTNTARSANATGLANNTTYYVRCRTTNSNGLTTVSSSGSSFKTYKQNTVTFTGSSTWTNPVPTSGTSGLAITSITDLVAVGGGGGMIGGGGGGGGEYKTSASLSVGSSVVVTIGAGAAVFSSNATATSIAGSTTLTAAIGQSGFYDGGTSGNGYAGGQADRDSAESGGGGGGAAGAGGDGNYNTRTGGNGGSGINGFGGGGGGAGSTTDGTPTGSGPANTGQGAGQDPNFADGYGNGGSGYAEFKYWGP